jgi:hypothetical protein
MKVYKIKCSNGMYVSGTSNGHWIDFTKAGKTWNSLNLVEKNFDYCEEFVERCIEIDDSRYKDLKFTIEEIG